MSELSQMLMMTTMMSSTARLISKELKIDRISGCLKQRKTKFKNTKDFKRRTFVNEVYLVS